jgi:general L-amino acid transport system permease protein
VFEVIPPRPAPPSAVGPLAWLRRNLFATPLSSLVTLALGTISVSVAVSFFHWVFVEATWSQVSANLRLFALFRYPVDLSWRPLLALALVLLLIGATAGAARGHVILESAFRWLTGFVAVFALIALFAWPAVRLWWWLVVAAALLGFALGRRAPRPSLRALPWAWALSFLIGFGLLYGVVPGEGLLRIAPAREWGGFMLTLILFTAIIPSFPLGIALALGRRSRLPAIRIASVAFIEIVRGAPLIMWLFVASLLLPLFLDTDPNRLPAILRAYVAITLFSAAYMAENVRGGLQAVGRGQTEAAVALGLSGWQTTRLIVLPQALRAVIPAIVGQAIGVFKDTSLVFVVGLTDFYRVTEAIASQPESLRIVGAGKLELYLFISVIYFFFSYRMSVASRQLERQLGVGTR